MKLATILRFLAPAALALASTAKATDFYLEKYTRSASGTSYAADGSGTLTSLSKTKSTTVVYRVFNVTTNQYSEIQLGTSGRQKTYEISTISTPTNLATLTTIAPFWTTNTFVLSTVPRKELVTRTTHANDFLFLGTLRHTGYMAGKTAPMSFAAPGAATTPVVLQAATLAGSSTENLNFLGGVGLSNVKLSAVPLTTTMKKVYSLPSSTRGSATYTRGTLQHAVAVVINGLEAAGYRDL